MPQNYFITGMPKSGKTTILRRVVKELQGRGLRVGGFISPEQKEHGTRVGFEIEDIETGRTSKLATTAPPGPRVGKYYVKTKSFEAIALPTMKNIDIYDIYVIDEVGKMERKSGKFLDMLDKAFESHTPLIVSISNEFVDDYGAFGEVIIVTLTNREAVFLDLVAKTTDSYIRKKPKKKLKPMKAKKKKPKGKKRMAKPKPKKVKKEKKMKKPKARKPKKAKKTKPPEKKPPKEKEEKPKKRRGIWGGIKELIGI